MRHHTRQYLYRVGFLTLRGEARLSGAAAIEIVLDILVGQRQQRRAAIDNAADRNAMAFAEGRDPKHMAEGVKGHRSRSLIECRSVPNVVTRATRPVKPSALVK